MRVALDPDDVEAIAQRVAELLRDELRQTGKADRWLDTREAAAYLGMTANALHKLTSARQIPFTQDRPGGKCWFRRADLDCWREGRGHGRAA